MQQIVAPVLVQRKGLATLELPPVQKLVAATVHRTVAFKFSSPFLYAKKQIPKWVSAFLVQRS